MQFSTNSAKIYNMMNNIGRDENFDSSSKALPKGQNSTFNLLGKRAAFN